MRRVRLQLLVFLVAVLTAVPCLAAPDKFRAALSGKEEVPRVSTPAKGDMRLEISGSEVSFELNVKGITRPTAAHIHKGKKGESGPPLAGLFGGPTKSGSFSGILANGVITEKNLLGELEGKTVADLAKMIKSGNTYVNVHTETYPAGEIRGQIKRR